MRGRPSKSKVKTRLLEILFKKKLSYGYELFKLYEQFYGKTSLRNIYYNLKKGVALGEIVVVDVKRVLGDYSWGDEVERVYYVLGPYAGVTDSSLKIKPRHLKHNSRVELNKLVKELKSETKKGNDKLKIINKCDKLIKWVNNHFKSNDQIIKEIKRIKNSLTP